MNVQKGCVVVVDNPEMPSLVKMAGNAAKSLAKNIFSIIQGNDLRVTDETFEFRMSICKGNTCGRYSDDDQCSECGCFLNVKARLYAEECPLKFWSIGEIHDNG